MVEKLECKYCTYISVEGNTCPFLYEDGSHKACHVCGAPLHPVRGCHKQWYHDRDAALEGKPNAMEPYRKKLWESESAEQQAVEAAQWHYRKDHRDPPLPGTGSPVKDIEYPAPVYEPQKTESLPPRVVNLPPREKVESLSKKLYKS